MDDLKPVKKNKPTRVQIEKNANKKEKKQKINKRMVDERKRTYAAFKKS